MLLRNVGYDPDRIFHYRRCENFPVGFIEIFFFSARGSRLLFTTVFATAFGGVVRLPSSANEGLL